MSLRAAWIPPQMVANPANYSTKADPVNENDRPLIIWM